MAKAFGEIENLRGSRGPDPIPEWLALLLDRKRYTTGG